MPEIIVPRNHQIDPVKSDREFTLSLKNGSQEAFRELFDQYHRKLYNVSRQFNICHEDAEGVVQDVFCTVWDKRAHLNEELSLGAFIMTICKRLVFKRIRSNTTRNKHEDTAKYQKPLSANSTEDYIVFSDLKNHADQSLEELSEHKKQIFMLSKQHGMTNDEIAAKLHISKRTVENQLYRATKEMKDRFNSFSK